MDSQDEKGPKEPKRKYQPPKLISEELTAFGAVCDGSTVGGRKTVAGPPDFCNPARLLS